MLPRNLVWSLIPEFFRSKLSLKTTWEDRKERKTRKVGGKGKKEEGGRGERGYPGPSSVGFKNKKLSCKIHRLQAALQKPSFRLKGNMDITESLKVWNFESWILLTHNSSGAIAQITQVWSPAWNQLHGADQSIGMQHFISGSFHNMTGSPISQGKWLFS